MTHASRPHLSAQLNPDRLTLIVHMVAVGVTLCAASPVQAHPHVWVTSASELIFNADGALTGIRQHWTFDDMFSTYALQGLVTKTKGVYTREELAPLAQTNVESLKEYGFFTFAKIDGRKQKLLDPIDYDLVYRNSTLTLRFTLPLRTPVPAKSLQIEIYDPSYFVDFTLEKNAPVTLLGAPKGCGLDITRPNDGSAQAKTIDENSFLNGANSNYGAMFANKIDVKCP